MAVYIALQNSICESSRKQDKTVAVQKCGNPPYELSLRFAGCILNCGACFASAYSWPDRYRNSKRVKADVPIKKLMEDFNRIPKNTYNWLRILGGEPLLNKDYIDYLFRFLMEIAAADTSCFRNGIVIQTNGIYLGLNGATLLEDYLRRIFEINPKLKIAIEISIKGTNPDEFELLSRSPKELFQANIKAYYRLKEINAKNLRPTIIAGFGISESMLLTGGKSSKSMMTILYNNDTPTFHPSIWSDSFKDLYESFTNDWKGENKAFVKMPMYGIKDEFNYMWVKYSLKQIKTMYGDKFYDSSFSVKNPNVERKMIEILDYFFLLNNQDYYSELIR